MREQKKPIDGVAAVNPKTIVVLETGSPATMPAEAGREVEACIREVERVLANVLTDSAKCKLAITFHGSTASDGRRCHHRRSN